MLCPACLPVRKHCRLTEIDGSGCPGTIHGCSDGCGHGRVSGCWDDLAYVDCGSNLRTCGNPDAEVL